MACPTSLIEIGPVLGGVLTQLIIVIGAAIGGYAVHAVQTSGPTLPGGK